MSYDIVVRFPTKKMADYFAGQMSDGFGEGFCNFSFWEQIEGTDGTKKEHFRKVKDELGRPVYFVSDVEKFQY